MSFLPGWFPANIIAAAAGLTTLTQVGSGTGTAINGAVTSSVTIQAGDLLVIFGDSFGSSASPPPGFTAVFTFIDTSTERFGFWYKIADGSEGTSVTGCSSNSGAANLLYVFRGDIAITAVSPSTPTKQSTTSNPSPQTVTASSGVPPLVVFGIYFASGAVSPRTFTVGGSAAKDGEINTGNYWLAYKIYNSSPADVVVDMDDEGSNSLGSCYLACS